MTDVIVVLGVFLVSFFLGSIPWGLIISRVFFHEDIRKHGSGNIGTTNAMRTMGKVGGTAVFILDFGKGLVSGFIGLYAVTHFVTGGGSPESGIFTRDLVLALATSGATLGHIFSPWLGFHGGKGIAAAIGGLFVAFGIPGAIAELSIFGILVLVTRFVSIGSMVSAGACPFLALYFMAGDWPAILCCAVTGFTCVWAHRTNIARLRAGTERRIGDKHKED